MLPAARTVGVFQRQVETGVVDHFDLAHMAGARFAGSERADCGAGARGREDGEGQEDDSAQDAPRNRGVWN